MPPCVCALHTAPPDATPRCASPQVSALDANAASRGGWLQRLNHHKQKFDVNIDWVDWQAADLTWCTQLLVNGAVAVQSIGCPKKQDARDTAARLYLMQHGPG
jgi:hypothetical protein